MSQEIRIPCELVIKIGSRSQQDRITLLASGEAAIDGYSQELSECERAVVDKITAAQSKALQSRFTRGR